MIQHSPSPVVHLELHTGNPARACSFYSRVCGSRLEQVEVGDRSYQAVGWGGGLEGGLHAASAGASSPSHSRALTSEQRLVSSADESLAVRTDRTYLPRSTTHSDLTAMNSERRAGLSRRQGA
jgi:predicted enzyme related to lactoylglutathione lyase